MKEQENKPKTLKVPNRRKEVPKTRQELEQTSEKLQEVQLLSKKQNQAKMENRPTPVNPNDSE